MHDNDKIIKRTCLKYLINNSLNQEFINLKIIRINTLNHSWSELYSIETTMAEKNL